MSAIYRVLHKIEYPLHFISEVINLMTTYLIALTSITYAIKAQNLLKSMGYYCEIQRTPKTLGTGCGYSIRVKGDMRAILKILENASITQNGYMEMGGS